VRRGEKDETCPVSTGGRTRRVQLVHGEGGRLALRYVQCQTACVAEHGPRRQVVVSLVFSDPLMMDYQIRTFAAFLPV
jgi:hypothetical protein